MKRIDITKSELQYMYESMTSKEACKKLGVCLATYYKMIKQAGIKRKRPDFKRGENILFNIID